MADLTIDNPFLDVREVAQAVIHPDWTMKQYLAYKGISRSSLWDLHTTSPYEYDWNKRNGVRKESDAMRLGTGVHVAVLEPDRLDGLYAVWDKRTDAGNMSPRRGKVWDAFEAKATSEGREVLTADQWTNLIRLRDYAYSLKGVRRLIEGGATEQTVTWRDPKTGEWVKARPDFYDAERGWVIDLKTMGDSQGGGIYNLHKLRREVLHRGYNAQAAIIREGLELAGCPVREHWILWIRTTGAPIARLTRLLPEAMSEGFDVYRSALGLYHQCRVSGEWPDPGGKPTDLPWITEL